MKSNITWIAILILLTAWLPLKAGDNHCRAASLELQDIYKHFEGNSLCDAIEELLGRGEIQTGGNDVSVRFNHGGLDNCLYIGCDNLLEFLVRNDEALAGTSLGFEFSIDTGKFSWDSLYGTFPPDSFIILDTSAFQASGKTWKDMSNTSKRPDSLLLGGVTFPGLAFLPKNDTAIVLYNLQIWIPDDSSLIGNSFCINNIFYPKAGSWSFTMLNGSEIKPPPTFQGKPNASGNNPDAPPVCFKIMAEPACEFGKSSSESDDDISIANNVFDSKEWPRNDKINYDDPNEFRFNQSGEIIIDAKIEFVGNLKDLKSFGVDMVPYQLAGNAVVCSFPLSLLPRICQICGVKNISRLPETVNN